MRFVLILLGFATIVVLLSGVVRFLLNGGNSPRESKEWPILVEVEHSHEIHTLKGVLEQEEVPVMVEAESSEAGGLPTNLTRNLLRVPPDRIQKALEVIRESDLDTENFRVRDGTP